MPVRERPAACLADRAANLESNAWLPDHVQVARLGNGPERNSPGLELQLRAKADAINPLHRRYAAQRHSPHQ
jgi:hypothetical protein